MVRLSAFPLILLVLIVLVSYQARPSAALAIATADDDSGADADAAGMDIEDDDDEPEGDDDSPAGEPETDKPAVINPEGEENASGYVLPAPGSAVFFDGFQDGLSKWTHTSFGDYLGRFVIGQGASPTFKGDRALIIPEKARKYGLSTVIAGFEDMTDKDFVVQYEVKLDQGMTCGGAYVKLPTTGFKPSEFNGATPYSIMFGPDKCGATDKVHFIFQSKNPVTGKMTEHHLKAPPSVANSYDRKTHIYTLSVKSDGKFQLFIDNELKKDGTLADSFEPPVQPPKEIDDPDDKKPSDWVDRDKVPDPDATKPDDWDEEAPKEIVDEDAKKPEGWLDNESEKIPDPKAEKPEEWDDDEDGEWEAPLVPNPKCDEVGCGEWKPPMKANPDYKGKWSAPLIDNPKYIGPWKPRKIPNKDYYEVSLPTLLPVHGLGFEIWTMDQGVLFDNVWVGSDLSAARKVSEATFVEKQKAEIERDEKANAEAEKNKKGSKQPRSGKLGEFMDKAEEVVDKIETLLEPAEAWLLKAGAEKFLEKLIDLGVQKPMIAVVSFPLFVVVLLLVVLGGKSSGPASSEERETGEAGVRKKSDEPSPDDAPSPGGEATEDKPIAEDESAADKETENATEDADCSTGDAETVQTKVRKRRTATTE